MFQEYDMVRLAEDINPLLKKGTVGVVLIVYEGEPRAYEVELFDNTHRTLSVETLRESQLCKE